MELKLNLQDYTEPEFLSLNCTISLRLRKVVQFTMSTALW
jgi:hypothetical protein